VYPIKKLNHLQLIAAGDSLLKKIFIAIPLIATALQSQLARATYDYGENWFRHTCTPTDATCKLQGKAVDMLATHWFGKRCTPQEIQQGCQEYLMRSNDQIYNDMFGPIFIEGPKKSFSGKGTLYGTIKLFASLLMSKANVSVDGLKRYPGDVTLYEVELLVGGQRVDDKRVGLDDYYPMPGGTDRQYTLAGKHYPPQSHNWNYPTADNLASITLSATVTDPKDIELRIVGLTPSVGSGLISAYVLTVYEQNLTFTVDRS
jgi:hypothetical protein